MSCFLIAFNFFFLTCKFKIIFLKLLNFKIFSFVIIFYILGDTCMLQKNCTLKADSVWHLIVFSYVLSKFQF